MEGTIIAISVGNYYYYLIAGLKQSLFKTKSFQKTEIQHTI